MGADGPGGDGEGCRSLGREGQAANGMRKTVSQAPPERCYKGDEEGLGVHKTWVLRASSQG